MEFTAQQSVQRLCDNQSFSGQATSNMVYDSRTSNDDSDNRR